MDTTLHKNEDYEPHELPGDAYAEVSYNVRPIVHKENKEEANYYEL